MPVSRRAEGSGTASRVEIEGDNVIVGACLKRKIESWVFPASADTWEFSLPFKFFNQ